MALVNISRNSLGVTNITMQVPTTNSIGPHMRAQRSGRTRRSGRTSRKTERILSVTPGRVRSILRLYLASFKILTGHNNVSVVYNYTITTLEFVIQTSVQRTTHKLVTTLNAALTNIRTGRITNNEGNNHILTRLTARILVQGHQSTRLNVRTHTSVFSVSGPTTSNGGQSSPGSGRSSLTIVISVRGHQRSGRRSLGTRRNNGATLSMMQMTVFGNSHVVRRFTAMQVKVRRSARNHTRQMTLTQRIIKLTGRRANHKGLFVGRRIGIRRRQARLRASGRHRSRRRTRGTRIGRMIRQVRTTSHLTRRVSTMNGKRRQIRPLRRT